MSTYRELQDRISLDYLNRTDLTSQVKRAIQSAIRTYAGRRYWFNEASTAVACTTGQSYLNVPSDFLHLDRLEVSYSGSALKLRPEPFNVIRDMNATSATSVPTHFAYHGNRFELALIPDSAYAINVYQLINLPTLSADADTNVWTTEAENLIVHHATIDLLVGVLHVADTNRVQQHATMRRDAFDELATLNAVRLTTKLRSTSF